MACSICKPNIVFLIFDYMFSERFGFIGDDDYARLWIELFSSQLNCFHHFISCSGCFLRILTKSLILKQELVVVDLNQYANLIYHFLRLFGKSRSLIK